MIINENYESPFMGNYFCHIKNSKAAFIAISKNAVTTLKNIAIFDKTNYLPQSEMETHGIIGYDENSPYLIQVEKMREFEEKHYKVLKFAIWRDPIERLISTYKFFCIEKHIRTYFHYLDLYRDCSFDRFMDFVEFELKKTNVLYQDEHIRRQCDYYKMNDVDYIVHIKDLEIFLKTFKISNVKEQYNKTTTDIKLDIAKHAPRIKELYHNDYKLEINFANDSCCINNCL